MLSLFAVISCLMKLLETLVGFVAGHRFPMPLNKTEEQFHLEAVRNGDMGSRNILVEHNLRLVAHIVKKFDPHPQEVEDLISIGSIGLVKAINTYKLDRGTRLATYASKCIENEILMHLRATKNERTELHLFDPLSSQEDESEVSYIDIVQDQEMDIVDAVTTKVEAENVIARFTVLDDKEREILEMRYGIGGRTVKTQREIAGLLGISRSYVSRIEKRALGRLAEACQLSLG